MQRKSVHKKRRGTASRERSLSLLRKGSDDTLDEAVPIEQRIGVSLSQNVDQTAICFFVVHVMPNMPGHYIELIPEALNKAPTSSALDAAIRAASLGIMVLHPRQRHLRPLAFARYIEAMKFARREMRDPDHCGSDEILMAVLLFGLFEVWLYGAIRLVGRRLTNPVL